MRPLCSTLVLLLPSIALAFDGGDGTSGAPYEISDCAQLDSIRTTSNYATSDFRLVADVDCDGFPAFASFDTPYEGTFDGAGYAIRNLTIGAGTSTALFRELGSTSVVRDLSILDVAGDIPANSSSYVGVLAAHAKGHIEDVVVTGALSVGRPGQIGGLVGYLQGGTMDRVHSAVDLTVVGAYGGYTVGGLVGLLNSSASVTLGSASGDIDYSGTGGTFVVLGGLFGRVIRSSCTECSATGDVTSADMTEPIAGGLVGRVQSSLPTALFTNVYATGDVMLADATGGSAGGLVGDAQTLAVTYAYATGAVSGPPDTAGFIAVDEGSLVVTDVLAAPRLPLQTGAYGYGASAPSGSAVFNDFHGSAIACTSSAATGCVRTTTAQSAYYTSDTAPLDQWDFTTVWEEVPGGYPKLINGVEPPSSVECIVGSPYDWDGNGDEDGCRGIGVTIADGVVVPAGTQMGDDVSVFAGATLGTGLVLHNGVVVGSRAALGDDITLLGGVVVGRRATLADRVVLGADTAVGRSASIGPDAVVTGVVGYGAEVGAHVSLPDAIVGNLVTIGHPDMSDGQVSCPGPLVLARSVVVAPGPTDTFSCTGMVVIGPESTVESGDFGSSIRLRKGVYLGATTTIADGVRLGRDVTTLGGVQVAADSVVRATVQLCDAATPFDGHYARDYVDPACQ